MQKKRNNAAIEIKIYDKKIDMEITAETKLQQAYKAAILNQRT